MANKATEIKGIAAYVIFNLILQYCNITNTLLAQPNIPTKEYLVHY